MESEVHTAVSALTDRLNQMLDSQPCKKGLIRLECAIPAIDLLGWLARQPAAGSIKAYWSDRNGDFVMAGLASAWTYPMDSVEDITSAFQKAREIMSDQANNKTLKCFSYLSFSDEVSQIWPQFGYGRVWLPLVDIIKTRKGFTLGCNLLIDSGQERQERITEIKAVLSQLFDQQQPIANNVLHLSEPYSNPDRQHWSNLVNLALRHLNEPVFDKVVLSKETCYPLDQSLSPWQIMQRWQQSNAHSYSFVFEGTDSHYFLGCSPERLIKRHNNIISTEALAGTSPRGKSEHKDREIAAELMNDHKNISENKLVLEDILSRLKPFCKRLEADRSHSILKLKNIQHLRYLIRGVLADDIKDEELVTVLHPTPAVGGTPRDDAHRFINKHEPYARGLYAGACGIIGIDMTELTVSIRSAQLKPKSISLYSGAGIVKGSLADSEWREINNKITTIQDILTSFQHTSHIS